MTATNLLAKVHTNSVITRAKELGYTVALIGPDFNVMRIRPTDKTDRYLPPVFYSQEDNCWKVEFAGAGALNHDEAAKMVEGYQKAVALVDFLFSFEIDWLAPYSI